METVSTKDLCVGYENIIVRDINISVSEGEIAVLIGPNGAGKTTLLKTICGIIPAKEGVVYLCDKALSDLSHKERAKIVATVLTEKTYAEYTCEEMVAMGRYPYTNGVFSLSKEDRKIVTESMKLAGVMDLASKNFLKISDGQRQRVLLARAICQKPKLLILDEPTSFLDVKYKIEFLKLLRKLSKEMEFSVLMSLHELDMAKQIADRLICIKNNKIDRVGSVAEIFSEGYIKELFDITSGEFDERTGLGLLWHTN